MRRDGRNGAGLTGLTRRDLGAGAAATALMLGAFGAGGEAAMTHINAFYPMDAALDARLAQGEIPGFVALVARGGEVHVHVGGVSDIETGAPMRRDTIFAVASIGKLLTAAAAMILVEDGVIGLDDPVDRFLPELANPRVIRSLEADLDDTIPANRAITLRDLLTMRFGIGAVFADPSGSPLLQHLWAQGLAPGPRLFQDTANEYMRRLGETPLIHQPGERWLYHTGFDVAGVLIARASGMTLGEFQRERICEPLGMTDTGFFVPPENANRLAPNYMRDPESGAFTPWNAASGASFAEPPAFEAGGGGQVSTVDDYLAFGRMLLNGGEFGGRRILSEASVREMTADQITPEQKAASPFFPDFWDTHGWGLGTAVITAPDEIAPTPGRFGWWGGFGTTFYCDPHTDSVALLFTQKMMSSADDTATSEEFLRLAFTGVRDMESGR